MTHPTHRLPTLALLPLALAACGDATPADPCGGAPGTATRGLSIDTLVQHWDWADDTGVVSHPAAAACATYTIEQPGSDWRRTGTTPAVVDLAPGAYEVQLDWTDGSCTYTSDRVSVDVTNGVVDVVVPLCVDLSGPWQCQDSHKSWSAEVEMVDGCTARFDGLADDLRLDGHLIEAAGVRGIVAPDGRVLEADAASLPVTCTRAD